MLRLSCSAVKAGRHRVTGNARMGLSMRLLIACVVIGMTLYITPSIAQVSGDRPLTKEQIDQLDSLEKSVEKIKQLRQNVDTLSRALKSDCLRTVGNDQFCNCLGEKLPWILSFQEYVSVVTSSKDQLAAANLSREQHEVVDKAAQARDECVASAFGQK